MAALTAKERRQAERRGREDAMALIRSAITHLMQDQQASIRTTHQQLADGTAHVNDDALAFLEAGLGLLEAERERIVKMIDKSVGGPL